MKKLSVHIVAHAFIWLVALQILNMGFFVQDFESLTPSSISDNNIINSVVEYVSEVVLNKVNAVPENNNKDNKDLQAHKHFTAKMIEFKKPSIIIPRVAHVCPIHFSVAENYYFQFCKEINPPPPKA